MTEEAGDVRIVRLSRDATGREVWLDYRTGEELIGMVDRSADMPGDAGLRVIASVLSEMDWPVQILTNGIVCCPVSGDIASYTLCFRLDEDESALLCMSQLPFTVPDEKRLRAADYINRANLGLRDGNFELDPDDGSAEFRAYSRFGDDRYLAETARQMTQLALVTCDQYIRGLLDVVFGGVPPSEAIERVRAPG